MSLYVIPFTVAINLHVIWVEFSCFVDSTLGTTKQIPRAAADATPPTVQNGTPNPPASKRADPMEGPRAKPIPNRASVKATTDPALSGNKTIRMETTEFQLAASAIPSKHLMNLALIRAGKLRKITSESRTKLRRQFCCSVGPGSQNKSSKGLAQWRL